MDFLGPQPNRAPVMIHLNLQGIVFRNVDASVLEEVASSICGLNRQRIVGRGFGSFHIRHERFLGRDAWRFVYTEELLVQVL